MTADPEARWPATYGVWLDELADVLAPSAIAQRWEQVIVDGAHRRQVNRSYARLDNDALADELRSRASRRGVRVHAGTAAGAASGPDGVTVLTHEGAMVNGVVAIDASGHPGVLMHRPLRAVPAWQVAHGIVATFAEPPIEAGSCVFMDWRAPGRADPDRGETPSFLYAMDRGDGTYLVEETVLAARRPPSTDVLGAVLRERLAASGAKINEIVATETVHIPMGGPLPFRRAVVGFGAAGSFGHPATGYSISASLRAAPRVADAIVHAFARRATPRALAAAAWDAVWPVGRRRVRALEEYGLAAMLRMNQVELAAFFDTFFTLPERAWSSYLTGAMSVRDCGATMRAVFANAPMSVRRRLMSGDVRRLAAIASR